MCVVKLLGKVKIAIIISLLSENGFRRSFYAQTPAWKLACPTFRLHCVTFREQ